MKVYRNSLFNAKKPEEAAKPAPAEKVDIAKRARQYNKEARKISDGLAPDDLHARYRALQETDPQAAGEFWRANRTAIYNQVIKRNNGG